MGEGSPSLVDGLRSKEAYPHPADDLQLRETHGAWVFLAGPYAYKVKKPVDFGFFDFSTAELRAADAEREVRLNRRLAPSTYLGVVDIVDENGRVRIGGTGRLLERAVKMKRLPEEGMLSSLVERNAASPVLIRRIARVLTRFHADALTGPGVDEHGGYDTIAANWAENFTQIEPFVGQSIPSWQLEAIKRYVTGALAQQRAVFHRRVDEGHVRDGHGDLHTRSICVDRRELVIFDCIEFSDRYRCADTAAEVAFLAMDLEHSGRPDLATVFVDEYVRRTADVELLDLLDFYKCYRATVRGKVLSFRLAEPDISSDERERVAREARAYFDLAATYAGGLPRPLLVAMCGLPASGKSTLAGSLSTRLGALVLSTDVTRKRRVGMRPNERAESSFGTGLYDAATTRATYAAMRRSARRWLAHGVSVILDGTFSDPGQRRLARKLAQRTGTRFLVAHTSLARTTLQARLRQRVKDDTRASDATEDTLERMAASFSFPAELPPHEYYEDTTGGQGADGVIDHLARFQTPLDTPQALLTPP